MNCNRVQTMLSAFIDRELDHDEKQELRAHLCSCKECNDEYQELLQLKSCFTNIAMETFSCSALANLKSRLATEETSFIGIHTHFVSFGRFSLVATCLAIFFVSTLVVFPLEQSLTKRFTAKNTSPSAMPASVSSLDENFSIDQSVNVYQASLVLP